jgi:hypothetical protein
METLTNDFSYRLFTWSIIILVIIGLWLYAIIDVLKSSFKKNDKISWLLVVLFIPLLGSIASLSTERKRKRLESL